MEGVFGVVRRYFAHRNELEMDAAQYDATGAEPAHYRRPRIVVRGEYDRRTAVDDEVRPAVEVHRDDGAGSDERDVDDAAVQRLIVREPWEMRPDRDHVDQVETVAADLHVRIAFGELDAPRAEVGAGAHAQVRPAVVHVPAHAGAIDERDVRQVAAAGHEHEARRRGAIGQRRQVRVSIGDESVRAQTRQRIADRRPARSVAVVHDRGRCARPGRAAATQRRRDKQREDERGEHEGRHETHGRQRRIPPLSSRAVGRSMQLRPYLNLAAKLRRLRSSTTVKCASALGAKRSRDFERNDDKWLRVGSPDPSRVQWDLRISYTIFSPTEYHFVPYTVAVPYMEYPIHRPYINPNDINLNEYDDMVYFISHWK